jgi:hypothetical protein
VRFTAKPPAGAGALDVTVITFALPLSGTSPAGAEIDTEGVDDTTAGQVIVAVKSAGFGAGVAVCVQVKDAFCAVACGVQLKPIAGAFAPSVAGAAILRVPPPVIAIDAVFAETEQLNASEPVPAPAPVTFTPSVPVPPVSVAVAAARAAVGAALVAPPVTSIDSVALMGTAVPEPSQTAPVPGSTIAPVGKLTLYVPDTMPAGTEIVYPATKIVGVVAGAPEFVDAPQSFSVVGSKRLFVPLISTALVAVKLSSGEEVTSRADSDAAGETGAVVVN